MSERIQRDTHDILVVISDEEEIFRKKFFLELGDAPNVRKCTICSKNTGSRLYPHPALRVTVCFTCYHAYEDTIFIINRDGTDTLCRWCGKPAEKYSCSKCTCIFCNDCLERNFGEAFVQSTIDNVSNEWSCLICYPKQLWGLRAYCTRAMDYQNSQTPSTSKQSRNVQDAEEEGYLSSSPKTNHSDTSSDTLAKPKKVPKPIVESDDDELPVSQNTNDRTVQLSQQNRSCSQNELLTEKRTIEAYEMFLDIKGRVDTFIQLFEKENKLFEKKAYIRENCVAYKNVEKIISKVHLFCEEAKKNLIFIDATAHEQFEEWSKKYHGSVSDDGISSSQEETASLGCSSLSTSPANNTRKLNNSASVSKVNDIISKPSTSGAINSAKKTCKKQFNLGLKHTEIVRENSNSAKCNENNSAGTLKQKDDTHKICCPELKVQLVDVMKYSPKKSPNKSPHKETNEDNSDTESHSSFSLNTWLLDETSKRRRKRKKKQIQIKEEIESESEILHQNIVSDDVENNSSVSTQIRDTRIEEDFNDADHLDDGNSVKLVHYLCDRTGDFIDCYTEGSETVDQLVATNNAMEEPIVENITGTLENPEINSNVEVGERMAEQNVTQELQARQLEGSGEVAQEDAVFENVTQQLQTEVREEVMQEDAVFENITQQLQPEVREEVMQEDAVFENITQQLQTEVGEQENNMCENLTQEIIVEECTNKSTTECSNNVSVDDRDEPRISEEDNLRLADVMRKITLTLDNLQKDIDDMEDKFGNESSNNDNELQNTDIVHTEHDDSVECDKDCEVNMDDNENTVKSTNLNEARNQNEIDSKEIIQETTLNSDNIIENGTSNMVVNDTDNIVDNPTDEVNNDDSDEDAKREAAYATLLNDSDDTLSDLDISSESDESSDESTVSFELKKEDDNPGYIQELNIEQEFQNICSKTNSHSVKIEENIKTELENISNTNNSDTDEDLIAQHYINDPKLLWKCSVKVDRINFENCYGLVRVSDSESYRLDSDNEEDEIRRLTNLKTLKRRASSRLSSGSSSDSFKTRKRFKKSDKRSDETSSSDSDETLSLDDDDLSTSTIAAKSLSSTDLSEGLLDDLLLNTDSEFENAEDCNESRVRKKSTRSNSEESTEKTKTDEIKLEEQQCAENRSSWRKDKLLTSNINFSEDSDATDDSRANAMLKERETPSSKYKSKEDDGNDSDLDALSSSLGSESDNDCIFVDIAAKRPFESINEDDEPKLVKKGRRNIKEVMSDDLLQEETKLADKEEEARKERIAMKHQSLDYVLSQSSMSEKEVGLVLDVDEVRKEPVVSVHPVLTSILKKHQCDGIKFMWDVCFESVSQLRHSNGAGCILAHCMGLGKTMQIVVLSHTLITHPVTKVKHILVVCPLSTVYNWKNEYEMSMNKVKNKITVYDVSPHSHKKLTDRICTVQRWRQTGGILLIGYESYQTLVMTRKNNPLSDNHQKEMQVALVNPGPDLVVCDEGHMLKNDKTARFKSLINLKTKRRIILTGTPLQNNLTEYYYMVKMVKPHLLGTINEYANRFVNPIVNGQYENSSADDINLMRKRSHVLHKKLETTVQRFEVSELQPYLPEKYDYVLFLKLSPLQIKLYQKYLELVDINKSLFKNFHALQNIWTHPALLQLKLNKKTQVKAKKVRTYDEDFVPELDPDSVSDELIDKDWFKPDCPDDLMSNVAHGPKMQILFSIISECQAIGDKLLVFSSSITELDLIEYFLKKRTSLDKIWIHGSNYFRMDGTVAPEVRMKYCNAFNNKKNTQAMLFLVSHKVGGLGLNLVAANRVVLMDVSWNPAYDIQSVFRIYRFGQEQQCFIYRLVSMGTMEEVVHSRAVTKLAISGRVVDERQINRHFRSDDLQKMYRLNIETKDPPRPTLPYDRLLAKLWDMHNPVLYKFHDHESMLENLPHEELNEEEMKLAWEEFHNEEELSRRQPENQTLQIADLANMFSKGNPVPGSSNGMYLPPMHVPISQKHNILHQRTIWNSTPSASNQTQPQNQRQPVSFPSQNSTKPTPSTSGTFHVTMPPPQLNNSNIKQRFVPNRIPNNLPNIRNGSGITPENTPIRSQPSSTLRPNQNLLNGIQIRPVHSLQNVYRRSQSVPGNNDPNMSNSQQQNIPNSNNPNPQNTSWFKPNAVERIRRTIQQNMQRNNNHSKSTLVTIPNPNNTITIPQAHSNLTSRPPQTSGIATNYQTPPPAHSTNNYAHLPSLIFNPASSNNASGTRLSSSSTNSSSPNPFKQTPNNVVVNPVALQSKNRNVRTPDPLALDSDLPPAAVNATVHDNPVPNRRQSAPEHFRSPNLPSTSNTIHTNTAAKSKSTPFGRSLPKFAQKENIIDYVNKLFETENDNLAPQASQLKIVNVTTLNDNATDMPDDFQQVEQDGAIQTTFNKPAVHRRNSTMRHSVIHNNSSTEVIELE
ncbi:XNP [Carabus blaptoides fortunei]